MNSLGNKIWEFAPPLNDMEWGIQQVVSGTNGPTGLDSVTVNITEWSGAMDLSTILVRKFYFPKLTLLDGGFQLVNGWATHLEFNQDVTFTGLFYSSVNPTFRGNCICEDTYNMDGATTLFTAVTLPRSVLNNITIASTALTSVDLSNLQTIATGKTWTISGALSEAEVDAILAKWVQLVDDNSISSGTLTLDGYTNSAPSAQGLTDKTTLEGAGLTVNVTP